MSELIIDRALPDSAFEPVGDGWTVFGRAVPYGVNQLVDDGRGPYRERFAVDAFRRDVGKGGRWVNLMIGHKGDDGERYIGRCVELDEQSDGLYAGFRLDRSHPLAEEARSGELRGWSVSAHVYRSRESRESGELVLVREVCGLRHVAATRSPQYAGAGVLVHREHELISARQRPAYELWRAKYPGASGQRPR